MAALHSGAGRGVGAGTPTLRGAPVYAYPGVCRWMAIQFAQKILKPL